MCWGVPSTSIVLNSLRKEKAEIHLPFYYMFRQYLIFFSQTITLNSAKLFTNN